jgi:hypothetical protein
MTRFHAMRSILIAALATLALNAFAADTKPEPKQENWFKRAGKGIAKDAKGGWEKARKGYAKGGKQIGRDTAGATKRVGKEMKESAKRTGKAAKEEFK